MSTFRKEGKVVRSRFLFFVEFVMLIISMGLSLFLGGQVGVRGGEGLSITLFIEPGSLLHYLYGIIELLFGIASFIVLGRQTFPNGLTKFLPPEMFALPPDQKIFISRARYIPAIFALGVFIGFIGGALRIFMQTILY